MLSNEDRQIHELTASGRAYLEYYRVTGGEAFGYSIGMPVKAMELIEELGGIEAMYKECIRRGICWEELLDWNGHSDEMKPYKKE